MIVAPDSGLRFTSKITFAPALIACSACWSCVFASPSALTMLYSTPSALNASSKKRRSSFSHRSELAESGSRTQMLPSAALPPVEPAPSSSSPPQPAAASASTATSSVSSVHSCDRRAPPALVLFLPLNTCLLLVGARERGCPDDKPQKLVNANWYGVGQPSAATRASA